MQKQYKGSKQYSKQGLADEVLRRRWANRNKRLSYPEERFNFYGAGLPPEKVKAKIKRDRTSAAIKVVALALLSWIALIILAATVGCMLARVM